MGEVARFGERDLKGKPSFKYEFRGTGQPHIRKSAASLNKTNIELSAALDLNFDR